MAPVHNARSHARRDKLSGAGNHVQSGIKILISVPFPYIIWKPTYLTNVLLLVIIMIMTNNNNNLEDKEGQTKRGRL
jgi:hypothetical protein